MNERERRAEREREEENKTYGNRKNKQKTNKQVEEDRTYYRPSLQSILCGDRRYRSMLKMERERESEKVIRIDEER